MYNPYAAFGAVQRPDLPFPFSSSIPPPTLVHPILAQPSAVPPPPPPPPETTAHPSTSRTFDQTTTHTSLLSTSLADMTVKQESTSKLSHTLQLPMPHLNAIDNNGTITQGLSIKREYSRPVYVFIYSVSLYFFYFYHFRIFNKRELPTVSENWGVGTLANYKIVAQVGEGTYGTNFSFFSLYHKTFKRPR